MTMFYYALKKIIVTNKQSFRDLFEPIAVDLAQNNNDRRKYTDGIRKNLGDLYIYVSQLKDTTEKIIKLYDFEINENKNNDTEVKA